MYNSACEHKSLCVTQILYNNNIHTAVIVLKYAVYNCQLANRISATAIYSRHAYTLNHLVRRAYACVCTRAHERHNRKRIPTKRVLADDDDVDD